jgi:hypothetical protein
MTTKEIKKELEGCEVISLSNEGVVGIYNGKVYRSGVEIKMKVRDWYQLWKEYVQQELGSPSQYLSSL